MKEKIGELLDREIAWIARCREKIEADNNKLKAMARKLKLRVDLLIDSLNLPIEQVDEPEEELDEDAEAEPEEDEAEEEQVQEPEFNCLHCKERFVRSCLKSGKCLWAGTRDAEELVARLQIHFQ